MRRVFVARFERRGGKIAQNGLVGDEPFADRLLMAASVFILAGAAAFLEPGVQRLKGSGMRNGRQKIGA